MWLLVLNRNSGKGKISKKFLEFKALCDAQNIKYQISVVVAVLEC